MAKEFSERLAARLGGAETTHSRGTADERR